MPAGSAPQFRQLLPAPGTVTAGQLLEPLDLVARAHAGRPYTVVNFISSADGRAAFRGRSGALSDAGDREMFHGLRERVDAVFVGTGTLRAERYGRLVRDAQRRRRRAAAGLAPDPLACLMTRSGDLPTDIPLFADPSSRVVVFSAGDVALDGVEATVDTVTLNRGELTLTTMLRRLRSDYDVRALLCEGGPTVFGALLHEDLVDELFLTIAPKLTGGANPTITAGPELGELRRMDLAWALEHDGYLYLRYALA